MLSNTYHSLKYSARGNIILHDNIFFHIHRHTNKQTNKKVKGGFSFSQATKTPISCFVKAQGIQPYTKTSLLSAFKENLNADLTMDTIMKQDSHYCALNNNLKKLNLSNILMFR